ncbi:DUF1349 domain-containing protein [Nocardioides sp. HDW12B]|uniref:DUF1349 domain-containing protein n=1 Tax=Nocardioides sp. HDW12B TaxID=2714939 RepID=UPI00140B31E2|nr:DUF1349 domain-containing protein [Nocardioides sp. HDW12B]QIK65737.1 DUF1349 domain-containing protein [Nocardioides sp. HDW12B]
MSSRDVPWSEGHWSHPPVQVVEDGTSLLVTAREGSDAWRHTSYGFVHDSEHALLAPLPNDAAVEVDVVLDYAEQFDQAGVFLHAAEDHWVKAGVEVSDGVAQLGAVVTRGRSDWSVAPVPDWRGRTVTVRLSRAGDAVTVRARAEGEAFRLVRVLPLDPEAAATAGPFCAAPTRAGLQVRFLAWRTGAPDASLH